jgi:hypothetical protein
MHILEAYVMSIVFSVVITCMLALKRWDFPVGQSQQFKIYLLWVIPFVNVIYGFLIMPYFFSDNPYRIPR